jgi:RNA polymerase sigma factor (sigma-70 family)
MSRPDADRAHEAQLVDRAKRGDISAYGELVRIHQREARRVAAAIGGLDIADDCAQEAFLRGFRSLHRFRAGAPFRPWLLTIVVHVTRNEMRSAARWNRKAMRSRDAERPDGTRASAEHEALVNDLHASVRSALQSLPSKYCEVVTCRYLLELTERETALVLDLPAGTVKSRLSRALDHIEARLQRETSDG